MTDLRWDTVFRNVLRDVLHQGETVVAGKSLSVGSDRQTLEVLNHRFTLENPRDRILWNPARRLNLFGGIARFFWMISGNDRLKDIAFYEPKVLGFSDDFMTIPGSDYGKRLFMPEPGLDQIQAVIKRIQEDQSTRRAVAVIYRPEDTIRESRDIPCAFGLGFHARGGGLHMTMIMRSNAAWTLLPYNVFEFTLLGELVSVVAGFELGRYTHLALSMHLYKATDDASDETARARDALAWEPADLPPPMPQMPPTTLEELRRLTRWEADLRYAAMGINVTNYRDYVARCRDEFHPYWVQLCLPLVAYVLLLHKHVSAAMTVLDDLEAPMKNALLMNPFVKGLNIPGLEEEPVLLESRLSLLRYASGESVPEERREELWRDFHSDFVKSLEPNDQQSRNRAPGALTVSDWARRDRQQKARESQRELFG